MLQHEILALSPGTEEKFLEIEAAILAKVATLSPEAADYSDDEEQSRLLQFADNVGVISVNGGLTNRVSFWNQFFGMVAYDEVRQAILEAADANVGAILFDINSPGGRVSGMADLGELISSLSMPTISFTNGSMASAAYFLGAQADHIYADSFAEVGSIGVVVKMYDRSEMLKKAGIKPVRFRSGDLKAVGDGDFKLSAKEKAYIQGKVDIFAAKFYEVVSDARGLTLPVMEKLGITSGRTFIGEEALTAGLVDKIKTFDQVVLEAYTLIEKAIDKNNKVGLSY